MKIAVLVEGKTESAFKPVLLDFLRNRLARRMPRLHFMPYHGRIPKEDKLNRVVENLLSGREPAEAVIALTDVYTGTRDFVDANDAKNKMRQWVGNVAAFYPHVALHDFEAWLLPYWSDIVRLAGHNLNCPGAHPETVNHNRPPAHRLKELFQAGRTRKSYNKPRDALRILKDKDLAVAANACPELKLFLNCIIRLAGGQVLP
jgi:hypothetical protein